jgi:hypothetical protein
MVASITSRQSLFHVGVIMAATGLLNQMRKEDGGRHFTHEAALATLRDEGYTSELGRCFNLPEHLPDQ